MRYLSLGEVTALHRRVIEEFGGSHGIRDLGALESAGSEPQRPTPPPVIPFAPSASVLLEPLSVRRDVQAKAESTVGDHWWPKIHLYIHLLDH